MANQHPTKRIGELQQQAEALRRKLALDAARHAIAALAMPFEDALDVPLFTGIAEIERKLEASLIADFEGGDTGTIATAAMTYGISWPQIFGLIQRIIARNDDGTVQYRDSDYGRIVGRRRGRHSQRKAA